MIFKVVLLQFGANKTCRITMDTDGMQAPVQDIIEKLNNVQSAAYVSWTQSGITDIEKKRRWDEFVANIFAGFQAFEKKQEAENRYRAQKKHRL